MARYQRWNALLDLLPGDGQLTVAEAARALSVSEATIRRDRNRRPARRRPGRPRPAGRLLTENLPAPYRECVVRP